MSTPDCRTGLEAVVFESGPRARWLTERTMRSAQHAGCTVHDCTGQPQTPLAGILANAQKPIWLLRAGAWIASLHPLTAPSSSASGKPLCAIGWLAAALSAEITAIAPPSAAATGEIASDSPLRPYCSDDAALWRQLYVEFGGDLTNAISTGRSIPHVYSALLEPPLAVAIAHRLQSGAILDDALRDELQSGSYRLVRYAPLDVHYDDRMRIAQVVTSLQRGGAERVTIDLARALQRQGTHCRIVTIGSPTRAPFPAPPGTCDLSQLPRDRAARVAAAIRVARSDGSDVVHAHLLDRTDLARFAEGGLTVVSTVHNTRPGWQAGQAELEAGESDLLVACAQAVEEELRQAKLPIPLRTVWNGTETREIARLGRDLELRRKFRAVRRIAYEDLVLLALANPRPQKRFPLLPAIVSEVEARLRQEGSQRKVHLLLAGEAAQSHPAARQAVEETNAAIAKYQLENAVTWLGPVADVAPVIAAADVLISASQHEGLSLAYVEALAAGLPVVATDVGGTRELAAEGVPLRLVAVDAAPHEFAAAVCDSAVARGSRASPLPDFTLERMAERCLWLYPRAIAAHRRRRANSRAGRGLWLITNNFSTGGAQSSARRLLTALARDGIPVRAAVLQEDPSHPTPGLESLVAAGLRVEVLPPARTIDPAAAAVRLLDLIDADPPQSVLFWNVIPEYKLLLADGLLDVPVFDVSPGEMYFASLARYFARPRPGLPYRTAADYGRRLHGVIVKYHSEKAVAETLLGAPVHVIPNGVSVGHRPHRPPANGHLVIGTAARISPQKRLEELIEAVSRAHSRLPPYTLRIAGAAETGAEPYADQLRHAARDLPVEWLGDVRDVSGFLEGLDLFAQVSEPAGCPNASLEALAAGLPIIATDVGGASEQVIDGVTGRLVERRNPAAFADALLELAANPDLRNQLARAGHDHARCRFSLDRMVADYRRVCLDPTSC